MSDTPASPPTLMTFPCDFPLKIMGEQTDEFRSLVLGIVQRHMGTIDSTAIEERPSKNGKYLGLTCTVNAQSQQQLDDLYRELTSCKKVLVAL
jgi:putative lipoic acid-binding regulatory protein